MIFQNIFRKMLNIIMVCNNILIIFFRSLIQIRILKPGASSKMSNLKK